MAEIIDINVNGSSFSIEFILKYFSSGLPHDRNTRHGHENVFENDNTSSNHDPLVRLEENIINSVNNLNEEIVDLRGIVIKGLQDENENYVQNAVLWKTKWKP